MTYQLRRVCSWCGVELPPLTVEHEPVKPVSHVICRECRDRVMAGLKKTNQVEKGDSES